MFGNYLLTSLKFRYQAFAAFIQTIYRLKKPYRNRVLGSNVLNGFFLHTQLDNCNPGIKVIFLNTVMKEFRREKFKSHQKHLFYFVSIPEEFKKYLKLIMHMTFGP